MEENGRKQPWEELEQDADKNQPQSSRMRVISSMENGRKRPREELGLEANQNQPQSSRMRTTPSFISVIRGAMLAETIRHICLSMEPIIRKVVHEEVQLLVCGPHPLYGNRQYYIEEEVPTPQSQPLQSRDLPTHKLVFANQVPQTIYTNNNITDNDKMPIEIQLIDINTGKICANEENSPIKVKIVVIDGDLELEGLDSDKLSSKIVKPRDGKRPLLVGNTEVNLNQGVGTIGDMYFTDNSRWLRSGKFRLGACIDSERCGTMIRFQEGLSEKFVVKDHRGESYEKHYPPMPNDDIWRLDIIAKDGKYHQKLKMNGINFVQDFLKFLNENPSELKEILKMSANSWNKVVKHAQTCRTGLNNANLKSNADLPTWPHETQTQTGGTYGNGAESEAGASPIIYSSFSPYHIRNHRNGKEPMEESSPQPNTEQEETETVRMENPVITQTGEGSGTKTKNSNFFEVTGAPQLEATLHLSPNQQVTQINSPLNQNTQVGNNGPEDLGPEKTKKFNFGFSWADLMEMKEEDGFNDEIGSLLGLPSPGRMDSPRLNCW